MKIGPLENKLGLSPPAGDRKSSSARAESASSSSARVDLSAVASLKVDADGEGAFDSAKVSRIAKMIREGQLRINAEAIADGLIANAREVLERRAA